MSRTVGNMETNSQSFAEDSIIDVLVPQESDLDVEAVLAAGAESDQFSILPTVTKRSVLFLDELVCFYVVLKTPYYDEAHLKSSLSRIRIVVEAEATDSMVTVRRPETPQERSTNQHKDILWSGVINSLEEPIIAIQEHDADAEQRFVLVVWKTVAFLGRPRIRLHQPSIVFKPIAEVLSSSKAHKNQIEDQYLPSHTPASINLLESLRGDPELEGVEPRLSALRLSALLPPVRQRSTGKTYPVPSSKKHTFPLRSAIGAKVRYSRCPSNSNQPTLNASLEVEATISPEIRISLDSVTAHLRGGSAENLTAPSELELPMLCQTRDITVFLYRLSPGSPAVDVPKVVNEPRALQITIEATVFISDTCQPRVRMQWNTAVDFASALNSRYRNPSQPLQRSNRPVSLQVSSSYDGRVSRSTSVSRNSTTLDECESPDQQERIHMNHLGITVTCTAPPRIEVEVPFYVDILIVNHADKPRDLAIVPIIRSWKSDTKVPMSRDSSSLGDARRLAGIVLEDDAMYLAHMSAGLGGTKLLSLSTDFRIGTLDGGSARTLELCFLPLALGVMPLDAIRVVDAFSNETFDIHDLPDLIAEERRRT